MDEIALHILDLIENSLSAGADKIEVIVNEDVKDDLLELIVRDNGRGMDEEELRKIDDPFFTTKGKKTGLGIPLLKQQAQLAGGDLEVKSVKGKGTEVRVRFGYSHIDRQPLGDVEKSIAVVISTHPDVDLSYTRLFNGRSFTFSHKKGTRPKYTELYNMLKKGVEEMYGKDGVLKKS